MAGQLEILVATKEKDEATPSNKFLVLPAILLRFRVIAVVATHGSATGAVL